MQLKRTCVCSACVVAMCFTLPLGMELYSAHSYKLNRIAEISAALTSGEYTGNKNNNSQQTQQQQSEVILLNEKAALCRESLIISDVGVLQENSAVKGKQIPTEKPSQEVLGLIKYPEKLEKHDGVISEYTYPRYTTAQYIDLSDGGQVRNNTTKPNSELAEQAKKQLPFTVDAKSEQPQVLIYHTHTTESFEPYERDFYDSSFASKTTDMSKNVVSVGDRICAELEKAGICYIHDTLVHDYPSYNDAYDSSRKTVSELLKKYPSVKVCLDIHRDGIQRADGTRISPVATINGKKAAQIMIISGCDDGTMGMPNCMQNFIFASKLQSQIESDNPTLTRPVLFDYRHYNQDLTTGSLLIEVGSHGNSIEQAQYSGELVGRSLAKLLTKNRA